jgi:hypothetical protein
MVRRGPLKQCKLCHLAFNTYYMEDFKDQIKQTKVDAEALTATVDKLYQKLGDLKQQQMGLAQSGQTNTQYYQTITTLIEKYKGKIDSTSDSLSVMNGRMYDQIRVLVSARERTEVWGKAWDGAKNKVDEISDKTEKFGKILGDSAAGFKPLTDNLKSAVTVVTPFKDAIAKANQAYTAYKESVASGNSRFEALKSIFPAITKGAEEGAGGFKNFKIALAETGIGLVIIVVAALLEKLKESKPVMDMVNGAMAAIGAVVKVATDTIADLVTGVSKFGDFFAHPIDSIKKLGTTMATAAKDAYNLVQAQEGLKAAAGAQDAVNGKLQDQIELYKQQATNGKLSAQERAVALANLKRAEEKYYKDNKAIKTRAMDLAIEQARQQTKLDGEEVKLLKATGVVYAAELLKRGKINQAQLDAIKKADDELRTLQKEDDATNKEYTEGQQKLKDEAAEKDRQRRAKQKAAHDKEVEEMHSFISEADDLRANSATQMGLMALNGYNLEVAQTELHYTKLLEKYKAYIEKYKKLSETDKSYAARHLKEYETVKKAITQVEEQKAADLALITEKFQQDAMQKLDAYNNELTTAAKKQGNTVLQLAIQQIEDEYEAKNKIVQSEIDESKKRKAKFKPAKDSANSEELINLQKKIDKENAIIARGEEVKKQLATKKDADKTTVTTAFAQQDEKAGIEDKIDTAHGKGDWKIEFQQKQQLLDLERQQAIDAAGKQETAIAKVKTDFDKKQRQLDKAKLDAQAESQKKYLKSTEALSNAVMGIFGKNTIASRIAFKAHQAAAAGQVIIDTKRSIMGIWAADGSIPFIGVPKAIAETAIVAAVGASSLASIIKQKPGFAQGGQYVSDGRGALLPGYSRTDNTNAYLRSGEAVVVSEAMRNPWARNLVSAINVAHGGRDFSVPHLGKGYAVGGIFTDGGNANRYYNQPMNDVKDLANTLAYQMINNFPPIYVDVKDVNNQQNILAQTVNRVNL